MNIMLFLLTPNFILRRFIAPGQKWANKNNAQHTLIIQSLTKTHVNAKVQFHENSFTLDYDLSIPTLFICYRKLP